jgi:hypothetical protein
LNEHFDDGECPKPPPDLPPVPPPRFEDSTTKVTMMSELPENITIPLCDFFNRENLSLISLHNYHNPEATKYLIIREFYMQDCPVDPDRSDGLNAFVLKIIHKAEWMNQEIFMCASSLRYDRDPRQYVPNNNYSVVQILHDERCGSESKPNAYIVKFTN